MYLSLRDTQGSIRDRGSWVEISLVVRVRWRPFPSTRSVQCLSLYLRSFVSFYSRTDPSVFLFTSMVMLILDSRESNLYSRELHSFFGVFTIVTIIFRSLTCHSAQRDFNTLMIENNTDGYGINMEYTIKMKLLLCPTVEQNCVDLCMVNSSLHTIQHSWEYYGTSNSEGIINWNSINWIN